jgi:uncharacterized protein
MDSPPKDITTNTAIVITVNKILVATIGLLLLFIAMASAYEVKGFVNDYANIIPANHSALIEGELKQLYDSDTAQFAVVTIPSLDGGSLEDISYKMAQGTLGNKTSNNGLLLLIAFKDHKWRFEVGRGLEPILNDAKIGRIGREQITPNFKAGDYGKGIYEAVLAVKKELTPVSGNYTTSETTQSTGDAPNPMWLLAIPGILILFISASKIFNEDTDSYSSGSVSDTLSDTKKDKDMTKYIVAAAVLSGLSRKKKRNDDDDDDDSYHSSSSSYSSGGGYSGGGGGFGGFGGGGFGGGGASGGW